jgi:HEAT repeat protein
MRRLFTLFAITFSFLITKDCFAAEYDKYLPKWLELLRKGNENERKLALSELWFLEYPEYRKDPKVFDPILQALKDKDPSVRAAAAASLKRIGELSKGCCKETEIVPSLIKALDDSHSRVREEASKALGYYKDRRAVDPLIKCLNDKEPWVRLNSVFSLGKLGEKMLFIGVASSDSGGGGIAFSVPILSKEEPKIRIPIQKEIDKPKETRKIVPIHGELGAEKALYPLLKLLNDNSDWRNKFIQQEVVIAIRKMWVYDNKKVVSLLIKKYDDEYLRAEVIKTLVKFEATEAKDIFLQAAKDSNEKIRRLAAETFLKLPVTAAKKDVDVFIKLLKDPYIEVRIPSAEVLGKFGDSRAVTPLMELLHESSKDVKRSAINALGNFSDARIFDAILNYGITDSDVKIRDSSINAFKSVAKRTSNGLVYVYRKGGIRYITNEISEDGKYVYLPRGVSYHKEHIIHPSAVDKLINSFKNPDTNIRLGILSIIEEFEDGRIEGHLLKLLNDPSPEVRKKTVSLLYDFGTDKAVPELIRSLKDNDKNVRVETIKALKAFPDKRVFEAFIDKLNDSDDSVRAMVLASLGNFDDPKVLDLSIKFLEDKSAFVKSTAVSNIKKMPDKRAVEPLISLLNNKDLRKEQVVELLGIIGDKSAAEPLIDILSNELNRDIKLSDNILKEYIIVALRKIADERAVPVLIKAFNQHKNSIDIRREAIKALGLMKDKRAIPVLIDALSDNNLRSNAIEALGNIGDPSTFDVLKGYLEDKNLKNITIYAIGNINDDRAFKILIDSLNSRDYSFVEMAIGSLGKRKDRRAIKPLLKLVGRDTGSHLIVKRALDEYKDPEMVDILISLLSDEDIEIKRGAIIVLGKFEDKKAVEPLNSLLENHDLQVRNFARNAIYDITISISSNLKDKKVTIASSPPSVPFFDIAPLIARLKNSDPKIRREAADTLGDAGDKKAVKYLIPFLKDESEYVRQAAARALGKLKDKEAVEPLIDNLKDSDINVKFFVIWALGEIKDHRAIEPLTTLLLDKEEIIADRSFEALRKFEEPEIRRIIVNALLKNPNKNFFLWRLISQEGEEVILKALEDPNGDNAKTVGNYIKLMEANITNVSYIGRNALKNYKDRTLVVSELVKFIKSEKLPSASISLLGELKDQRCLPVLIDIIKNKESPARYVAINVIGNFDDKNITGVLLEILNNLNEHLGMRDHAARAIGKLGDANAVEPLINILMNKKEHKDVRSGVTVALGAIRDKRAVGSLINILKDSNEDVWLRVAAVSALGDIGDARAVEPIEDATKDPSVYVKNAAQNALSKFKK